MNLKEKLIKENKLRWLDVGSGGNFEEGFHYIDTIPTSIIDEKHRDRYFRVDMTSTINEELENIGKFDLVRMQHTFEHFTYEEGLRVLKTCADLLNEGGIILISVPDLKVHIQKYLNDEYKEWKGFGWWANKRIPEDAPNSFYFSIFAHSMPYESHKWCYDFEGLKYQLEKSDCFIDIKKLEIDDGLSSTPFTHNRPEEDVCVMAIKKHG